MKYFVLLETILCTSKHFNHKHIGCIEINGDDREKSHTH